MKSLASIILAAELISGTVNAQDTNFSGKVVNNSQQGLEGKKVEVYFDQGSGQIAYHGWTNSQGNFLVNQTSTPVEQENELPEGYAISQNYPNPFNHKTFIVINLPKNSIISLDVYTILGEKLLSSDRKEFLAGNNSLAIELNGSSNGVYIARINIDDKYFISRKLLLIYGSQHASELPIPNYKFLEKTVITTNIDSVVITGDAIERSVFTGFPQYTTNNIDLGTFQVDSNYVNLTLNVKKLMEWKQANNQLANATVNISGIEKTTDNNGQAIFEHIPSGRNNLMITHPDTYERETIIRLENDSTHTEYILDTLNFTTPMMDFYNDVFGRIWPGFGYQASRWTEPPIFYIVADTTQEPGRWRTLQQIEKIDAVLAPAYTSPEYPEGFLKDYQVEIGTNPPYVTSGYYIIEWKNIAPYGGLTSVRTDITTGKILYAYTEYNELLDHYEMDIVTIHELSTGMSAAGRSDAISSVWNGSPFYNERNFVPTDLQMILYQYTRPPGNKIIDKDDGY